MPKLPKQYQFIDISDYGRLPARGIANVLSKTKVTPIHVTTGFIIAGLIAILCMLFQYYLSAAFFLILKSVLDAADGELSRLKNQPSYVGRYYDSIADMILNLLFFATLGYITGTPAILVLFAFVGAQLQGTLYNYYYVILRNQVAGDTTSQIFEDSPPTALEGEHQVHVNLFYNIYDFLYIPFDKTIYWLDRNARNSRNFPKWFMTALSSFGLGFQLLVMSLFLVFNMPEKVFPFFIGWTLLLFFFIGIRKIFLH